MVVELTSAAELSSDITVITAEINSYKHVAGQAIFEIGRRLKHVKENDLAHGQFGKWLAESVQFTDRQARRLMQVADEFKTDDVVRIGSSKIFELLQLPSEIDRQDFVSAPHTIPSTGATKTVDEMTVRELREVKAQLKAEREARERAEIERDRAREDYDVVRETLESVEAAPPHVTNETDVNSSAEQFSGDVRELIRRHAYLEHYVTEFKYAEDSVRREYQTALDALYDFVDKLAGALGKTDAVIIDIN